MFVCLSSSLRVLSTVSLYYINFQFITHGFCVLWCFPLNICNLCIVYLVHVYYRWFLSLYLEYPLKESFLENMEMFLSQHPSAEALSIVSCSKPFELALGQTMLEISKYQTRQRCFPQLFYQTQF